MSPTSFHGMPPVTTLRTWTTDSIRSESAWPYVRHLIRSYSNRPYNRGHVVQASISYMPNIISSVDETDSPAPAPSLPSLPSLPPNEARSTASDPATQQDWGQCHALHPLRIKKQVSQTAGHRAADAHGGSMETCQGRLCYQMCLVLSVLFVPPPSRQCATPHSSSDHKERDCIGHERPV
ncbi:hypothetical protein MY5147_007758 [Beauveria neobassiana]